MINEVMDKTIPSLEELFSSRGRVRILFILIKAGELNISEISRRAKLNYTTVAKHLEFLTQSGLLEEKHFGRIKIYRFKQETIFGRALKNLFELWDTFQSHSDI